MLRIIRLSSLKLNKSSRHVWTMSKNFYNDGGFAHCTFQNSNFPACRHPVLKKWILPIEKFQLFKNVDVFYTFYISNVCFDYSYAMDFSKFKTSVEALDYVKCRRNSFNQGEKEEKKFYNSEEQVKIRSGEIDSEGKSLSMYVEDMQVDARMIDPRHDLAFATMLPAHKKIKRTSNRISSLELEMRVEKHENFNIWNGYKMSRIKNPLAKKMNKIM